MAKAWLNGFLVVSLLAVSGAALTGCESADDSNPAVSGGHAPGSTQAVGTPDNPSGLPGGATPNGNTMVIGVKYVALRNSAGDAPSPTQDQVVALFQNMSQVWSQCDIQFRVEAYSSPVASADGQPYYPANQSDLEAMRGKYDDHAHALYVRSGTWNRSGDLGNDGSNGFSTIPPSNPEGTVFEQSVQTATLLLAHETGHLIGGLGHLSDSTSLMNHFVSPTNTQLSQWECDDTRAAMRQYHAAWIR
ncbi:MAG: matrixin family metalloprotease [Deltaproteobacteria bacterium]|nr:matrixin family metalloprotease [Deltaproteobacteria bacterium]